MDESGREFKPRNVARLQYLDFENDTRVSQRTQDFEVIYVLQIDVKVTLIESAALSQTK